MTHLAPRIDEGRICCCSYDDDGNPVMPRRGEADMCDKCKAHFRAANLKTLAEFPAPDPYKADLEQRRKDDPTLAKTRPPTSPIPLDKHGIPDIYGEGLRKMREENKR